MATRDTADHKRKKTRSINHIKVHSIHQSNDNVQRNGTKRYQIGKTPNKIESQISEKKEYKDWKKTDQAALFQNDSHLLPHGFEPFSLLLRIDK